MEKSNGSPHSHLFTVRVWEEEIEADSTELRGKVQMFPSGEVRYFREWATLVPLLRTMLAELKSESDMQQS
jgi:hypothetical protein